MCVFYSLNSAWSAKKIEIIESEKITHVVSVGNHFKEVFSHVKTFFNSLIHTFILIRSTFSYLFHLYLLFLFFIIEKSIQR